MKKNITVNIFGSLYPMDEDAYAMLNAYITNMRDYFSHRSDGKEIADDIEARAAELMSELMHSGVEAISIEHVNDIITRIGNPEELNCEDDMTDDSIDNPKDRDESSSEDKTRKKLFRDLDHKIIGGVCSGLGGYLGINPVWIRLIAIILLWPSFGIIVALYAICWIGIPPAVTPEERLQMKGKPVNASNICQEFLSSTREIIEKTGTFASDNGVSKSIVSIIRCIVYGCVILLAILLILAILGVITSIVCAISTPWSNLSGIINDSFPLYAVMSCNPLWLVATCGVSLLIMLLLTLLCGTHCAFHLMGKIQPMSIWLRISCVVLWLTAFVFFIATSSRIISNIGMYYGPRSEKAHQEREENRIRNQREFLESQGWTIVKDNNLKGGYTRSDKHFSDVDISYPHATAKSNNGVMEYEIVRHEKVAPGNYRLTAAGRTDGKGAEIFAVDGSGKRYFSQIPVCGNSGGTIWQNAKNALEADSLKTRPDRGYLTGIYNAHDKKGYGWSEIVIDNITVGADSILTYGVTNVSPSHTWEGTWFSATDFELQKK